MKITPKDRADWNARGETEVWRGEKSKAWYAEWGHPTKFGCASTKSAAINAAIRAERKGKEKR